MRRVTTTVVSLAVVSLTSLGATSPSFAASPWWHLSSGAVPAVLQPAVKGEIVLTAANLGDVDVDGGKPTTKVSIVDKLPPHFSALSIRGSSGEGEFNRGPVACFLAELTCTFAGTLPPYRTIEVTIGVEAQAEAVSGALNEATVSGGGAASVSSVQPLPVGEPPGFGVQYFEMTPEEEGGAPDTQAGSHPFQLTTSLAVNQELEVNYAQVPTGELRPRPVVLSKDLNFRLPPGLIGNPTPIPRCTIGQFLASVEESFEPVPSCSSQTAVGVARVFLNEPPRTLHHFSVPLFELEPAVGEPARFGFRILSTPIILDTSVRTGSDYGVTVSASNITQTVGFLSEQVTFWGVPGDPRHDSARGYGCLAQAVGRTHELPCNPLEEQHPPPLLSLPTSCPSDPSTLEPEALRAVVEADSWASPGAFLPFSDELPAMDGCNRLPFGPSISVTPDGQAGSTPTGLTVDVHVPQDSVLVAEGLAESNVKNITVTLPEGVVLNPAAADGLQACSESQIGYLPGQSKPPGELAFTPTLPEPLLQGVSFCPDAAKVGAVKIKSPLLPPGQALEGSVYLASPQNLAAPPQENPFGSLIAMYIEAKDPISGVLVKLPGRVSLNEATGRISATFENTPQLAFEDAEIHFFGGDRAPLATPARCGTYTTEASFTPWSGNAAVRSQSSFQIVTGPNGSPCPNPLPFAPALTAGATSIQAGGFSPFTMTMSREDGNQDLQAISLHMPPGLSGLLSSVKLCAEPQADQGTCGPESEIGETTVSVGLGGDPFSVKGGKVFVTGGYEGAPYGLSIVNPAKAGPFSLGTVVVRARIEVDPTTAALTITSDNTGPYKIPHILDGIPLQIKHVNVTINRPGFTFNPTNCNPMSITGSLSSTEGASAALSVPLQVTNCAVLHFKPGFSVSTSGKTSRANGASLHVKLVYPKAPFGSQANIRSVKVNLPKQLPSRLTTLQKACPDSTFNANPAACSPESRIGEAKATTPLLPVPLSGPVYFVSHGGAKFPELVIVLSGYGTTVQLHAETFISKAGITSSTFRTVPDVPVGTFELTLPQGKFSALAANGNLCKSTLKMPTAFTAQNGAVIHQSTPISVTGCAKAKKKAKKK